jgi:microcompartment protein CcmK/EutM
MPRSALVLGSADRGEEVIAFDQMGVQSGDLIGLSEGREAANPFGKIKIPIDAYAACLLDQIDVG